MSLKQTEDQAAAVAQTPNRITLEHMESLIAGEFYMNGASAAGFSGGEANTQSGGPLAALAAVTVCMIVTRNGFVLIGHSAPADPKNYNAPLGRSIAREKALAQLWPLEGYALRTRMALAEAGEAAQRELEENGDE